MSVGQGMSSLKLTRVVGIAMMCAVPVICMKKNVKSLENDGESRSIKDMLKNARVQLKNVHDRGCEVGPAFGMEYGKWMVKSHGEYVVVGLVSGFCSGLLGIGGGILMTTYLNAMSEMDQIQIIGTSLLAMVPIGISSSYHHLKLGNVHVKIAAVLASTLCASVWLTAIYVTLQVPQQKLRMVFAGTLAFSSIAMLKKTI